MQMVDVFGLEQDEPIVIVVQRCICFTTKSHTTLQTAATSSFLLLTFHALCLCNFHARIDARAIFANMCTHLSIFFPALHNVIVLKHLYR